MRYLLLFILLLPLSAAVTWEYPTPEDRAITTHQITIHATCLEGDVTIYFAPIHSPLENYPAVQSQNGTYETNAQPGVYQYTASCTNGDTIIFDQTSRIWSYLTPEQATHCARLYPPELGWTLQTWLDNNESLPITTYNITTTPEGIRIVEYVTTNDEIIYTHVMDYPNETLIEICRTQEDPNLLSIKTTPPPEIHQRRNSYLTQTTYTSEDISASIIDTITTILIVLASFSVIIAAGIAYKFFKKH